MTYNREFLYRGSTSYTSCSLDNYSNGTKLTGTQKTHTDTYNAHWLVVHNNVHWYSTLV